MAQGERGLADLSALTDLAIDSVALTGPDERLRAARRALARRDGPILPLISTLCAPQDFAHERVLSIDTTAAGGNAELLARTG